MGKSEKPKEKSEKQKKKELIYSIAILLVTLGIVVMLTIIYFNVSRKPAEEETKELAYTELIKKISANEVEKIEMTVGSGSLKVKLKEEEEEKTTLMPNTQAFIELVQKRIEEGNEIELIQNKQNIWLTIGDKTFSILPMIMIVILFGFVFKMMGLGDKGKVYGGEEDNDTGITFEDVAGLDEEKGELIEIVDFLKEPQKFYDMGAKIPKGILLFGKPGTGKTLIARAIAGEADVPFISMSGSEFIEMFAGLGASRVRKLFEKAKRISPCIIFIDEIDAIGERRAGGGGGESENNQTLNQLLVELDGFETNETVIVLAATNRPEMLDKALLRPGRFDRQITIAIPDLRGREEILKIHGKNKKFAQNVKLKDIAGETAGFTGAELSNILNEAAILAARKERKEIAMDDIEEAVKKVTVGLEKTSRVVSEKDKKLTAYHEAGHAVVSKFLPTQENVKEVSIIPRGVAGGYTMYKTNEDKYYISKTEMEENLIALLGGRAAEKIALDDISTGASNDIEIATQIAQDMVTTYGMSEKIGPIAIKMDDPRKIQIVGENMEDAIGQEVKAMIDVAYESAQRILSEHMNILDQVAARLLEKEIISSEEFEQFFH